MTLSTISSEDVDSRFAEIVAAEWPKLTGRQTPESLLYTAGDFDLGRRAAALGKLSASRIRTMPWQLWSLERIMARNADGTWTHPECCLIVPRQNGKSLILSLRVLYGLFKLGENIVFSAQQWETAKALWKRTFAIVKSTPWMMKRVVSHTCSQGRGTIVLESGAQVVFTTRSPNAGRGLDQVDLEIYDEAYDLTEADMAALSPTKMAASDPQTIYTSSAVNAEQHPNGRVLAAVRRRGLEKLEAGLFFAEWMAPEEHDRARPETWALANPSHGVIGTDKKLEAELKKFSTAAGRKSFDVEYLGRGDWPKDITEIEPVIPLDVWNDCVARPSERAGPPALSVEMAPDESWISIAAAYPTHDGRIHVEVGYSAAKLIRPAALLATLVARWDPCAIVIDRASPAISLVPELLGLKIEPEQIGKAEQAQACVGLADAAELRAVTHTGDPALVTALQAAEKVVVPGGWVWDTRAGGSAVTPLKAITQAHYGLRRFGIVAGPPPAPSWDDEVAVGSDYVDVMSVAF